MEQDEARTLDTLRAHFQAMDSLVGELRGRVAAIHGDSLLAEFERRDAVQCAVEMQNDLKGRNEKSAGGGPDALPDRDQPRGRDRGRWEIYGDGVNVAARLKGLADPGGSASPGASTTM